MRAYRVAVGDKFVFTANQTLAREKRQELEKEAGAKRGAGTVEEVEIPVAKDDLLGFINDLVVSMRQTDKEDDA